MQAQSLQPYEGLRVISMPKSSMFQKDASLHFIGLIDRNENFEGTDI